ncbi:MAG: hypothetical protein M5R36_19890 [Deltaproteobacteria bacterium]|nr:hypothetical protein [Deltaproteobacteria bacterium]
MGFSWVLSAHGGERPRAPGGRDAQFRPHVTQVLGDFAGEFFLEVRERGRNVPALHREFESGAVPSAEDDALRREDEKGTFLGLLERDEMAHVRHRPRPASREDHRENNDDGRTKRVAHGGIIRSEEPR